MFSNAITQTSQNVQGIPRKIFVMVLMWQTILITLVLDTLNHEECPKPLGYNARIIWELDFKKHRETVVITDFLDTADFMTNINPQGWVQTVIQR